MLLATVVTHTIGSSTASVHLELWQVINLVGSIALAALLLPPVIEDIQKWRTKAAGRR